MDKNNLNISCKSIVQITFDVSINPLAEGSSQSIYDFYREVDELIEKHSKKNENVFFKQCLGNIFTHKTKK